MVRSKISAAVARRIRKQARIAYVPITTHIRRHGSNIFDGVPMGFVSSVRPLLDEQPHLSDDPDVLIVCSFWVSAGWHPPDK